jgi:hypothetical protein
MYKIPILKSANAIFSPKDGSQTIVLNIKLKIGRVKNNQVGIGW